jgi:two-component system LytT family response regulator
MLSAIVVDDGRRPRGLKRCSRPPAASGPGGAPTPSRAGRDPRLRPDVVFLDIQMPRVSGLEMVAMIDPSAMPSVVFVTAYDEHALKAFEEHATDYLLKPIDPRRLARTLDWLQGGARPMPRTPPATDGRLHHVPCLSRNRVVLLPMGEIEYVNSELSGVQVVCAGRQGTELTLVAGAPRRAPPAIPRQPDQVTQIELLDNGAADRHAKREESAGEPTLPARNQGHAAHRLILPGAAGATCRPLAAPANRSRETGLGPSALALDCPA